MSDHTQAGHGPQLTLVRLVLLGAAFATAGAGVVHLDTAGDHSHHAFVAAFFVTAGLVQVLLAVALGQRMLHRLVIPAAVGVNAGLLVTWALSRTVGLDALPVLGSVPGVAGTESVGTKDLATAGLELMALLLVGLASATPAAAGAALLLPVAARTSLAGLLAVALALTVPGVLASHDASHHDAHTHGAEAGGHEHEGGEHPADHPHGAEADHEGHEGDDHATRGGDHTTHGDDHTTEGGHVHSVGHGGAGGHGNGHGGHGGHENHGNGGGGHENHGNGGGGHENHGNGGHNEGEHGEHEAIAEPDPLAGPGRISTARIGPFLIPPSLPKPIQMPHTSPLLPMVLPGRLNLLPLTGIKSPCTDCYILGAQPDLVYKDGRVANLDTGPMLHHAVIMNPERRDPICPTAAPGLLGERLVAAGNERTGLALPEGYGVPHGDGTLNGAVELMNMSNQFRSVYLELKVRWVPQSTPGIEPLRPLWLDIDSCGDSEVDVDKGVTDVRWDWTSNVTGRMIAAGGHLHDGGEWLSLHNATTGQHMCTSVADYGNHPEYLGTLDTMSTCSWDSLGGVRKGETLRLNAHYNTASPQRGVMGIMIAFLYETNDIDGGKPSPYPTKPPPDGAPPDGGHNH